MTDKSPILSIITSVLNADDHIEELLKSVKSQQAFNQFEWIVIDGGSRDKTVSILNNNQELIDHLIIEKDNGIYEAWNKGLRYVSGEWILFVGADDRFLNSDSVKKLIEYLQTLSSEVAWITSPVLQFYPNGKTILVGSEWKRSRRRFFSYMNIPHQGVVQRKSLFDEIGLFNENFRIAGDYDWLLRTLKNGYEPHYYNEPTILMSGSGISASPMNSIQSLLEMRASRVALNLKENQLFAWHWSYIKARFKFWIQSMFGDNLSLKLIDLFRVLTFRPTIYS